MTDRSASLLGNLQAVLQNLQKLIGDVIGEIQYRTNPSFLSGSTAWPSAKERKVTQSQEMQSLKSDSSRAAAINESKLSKLGFFGSSGETAEAYRLTKLMLEGTEIAYLESLLQEFLTKCRSPATSEKVSPPVPAKPDSSAKTSRNEYLNLIGDDVDEEILAGSKEVSLERSASELSLNYHTVESIPESPGAEIQQRQSATVSPVNPKHLKKQFSVIREETEESVCEGSVLEMKVPKQDIAEVFKVNLKPGFSVKKHPSESSAQLKDGKLETESSESDSELDDSKTLRKPNIRPTVRPNTEKPYSIKTIPSGSNISPIDTSSRFIADSVFGSNQGRPTSLSEEPTLLQASNAYQARTADSVHKPTYIISSAKKDGDTYIRGDQTKKYRTNPTTENANGLKPPEYQDSLSRHSDNSSSIRISSSKTKQSKPDQPAERPGYVSGYSFVQQDAGLQERSAKSVPRRLASWEDQPSGQQIFNPQSPPRRTTSLNRRPSRGHKSQNTSASGVSENRESELAEYRASKTRFIRNDTFHKQAGADSGSLKSTNLSASLMRGVSPPMIVRRRLKDNKDAGIIYQDTDVARYPPAEHSAQSRESLRSKRRLAPTTTPQLYRSQDLDKDYLENRGILASLTHSSSIRKPDAHLVDKATSWGMKKDRVVDQPAIYSEMPRGSHEPLVSAKVIYENLVNFKKDKFSGEDTEGGPSTTRSLFQKTKRSTRNPLAGDKIQK